MKPQFEQVPKVHLIYLKTKTKKNETTVRQTPKVNLIYLKTNDNVTVIKFYSETIRVITL